MSRVIELSSDTAQFLLTGKIHDRNEQRDTTNDSLCLFDIEEKLTNEKTMV